MDIPENAIPALVLTMIAGLSTGIGSSIAYFIKKPRTIYLSFSLGFSAGVMIYISFVELLPSAMDVIGELMGIIVFFIGIVFIALIDMLIPESENPHHYKGPSDITDAEDEKIFSNVKNKKALMRTGLFTAVAITIHNFPEGLATLGVALTDVRLGVVIAFAIAIHNIPEGISVSMPIYYATGDKKKAFKYSFLSGAAEPVGALIGFLILMPFLSEGLLSSLLAFVAGIMVYISVDELLPMAHRFGHNHTVVIGIILGMFIMALSLLML